MFGLLFINVNEELRMSSVITYDPTKETPRPRTGARGFNTAKSGSVHLDPRVATPISDELLAELEQDITFKALKESGAITITIEDQKQQESISVSPLIVSPLDPIESPPIVPSVEPKKLK